MEPLVGKPTLQMSTVLHILNTVGSVAQRKYPWGAPAVKTKVNIVIKIHNVKGRETNPMEVILFLHHPSCCRVGSPTVRIKPNILTKFAMSKVDKSTLRRWPSFSRINCPSETPLGYIHRQNKAWQYDRFLSTV